MCSKSHNQENGKNRTLWFRISIPDVRATCGTCKGDRPIAKESCLEIFFIFTYVSLPQSINRYIKQGHSETILASFFLQGEVQLVGYKSRQSVIWKSIKLLSTYRGRLNPSRLFSRVFHTCVIHARKLRQSQVSLLQRKEM